MSANQPKLNPVCITQTDAPSIAPWRVIRFFARKHGIADLTQIPGERALQFVVSIHKKLISNFIVRNEDSSGRVYAGRLKWYYDLTLFLLEQSDLLLCLEPELRDQKRNELGRIYQDAKNYHTALDLYQQDTSKQSKLPGESYVDKILTKIQKTGYLFNCTNTMELVAMLFRINRVLQLDKMPQLIEIMLRGELKLWQQEPLRSSLDGLFEHYILTMSEMVNRMPSFSGRNETPLKLLIQALAIHLYLTSGTERFSHLFHSMLYRYAASMPAVNSEAKRRALLDSAYAVLVAPSKISYQWADIAQLDKLVILLSNDKRKVGAIEKPHLYQTETARLMLSSDEVLLSPRHLVVDDEESVLPKGLIPWQNLRVVLGDKMAEKITSRTTDVTKLHLWWNELERHLLTRTVAAESPATTKQRLRPQLNDKVQIVVDGIDNLTLKRYKCHIVGNLYEGYGTIDLADVAPFSVPDFSPAMAMEFFRNSEKIPYVIEATIKSELSDGSYQFRIPATLIEDKLRRLEECQYGYESLCVVTVSNAKMVVGISEDGYSVVLPANPELRNGDFFIASLMGKGRNARTLQFDAEFVELSDERFDRAEPVITMMYLYAGDTLYEAPTEEEVVAPTEESPVAPLSPVVVKQLVALVDDCSMLSEKVEVRYNYLSLAKLLSLMVGDKLLIEQYELRLKGLRMMEDFSKNSSFDSEALQELSRIDPQLLRRLPRLKRRIEEIDLLTKLNAPQHTAELMNRLSQPMTPEMQRLASLVLAYNLLSDFDLSGQKEAILKQIGGLVGLNLRIDTTNRLDVEEGEQVEFKTSVVYKANSEGRMEPDTKGQMRVILRVLCSFMNTKGGKLYLGVNDYSVVNGLDNDLMWFREHPGYNIGDMDDYQRYITDHIAREWRNQMDLISVTVEGEGSHRYVVIEVRPGDPVSLDDRYYFRIGSECREVTEEGREGWLERRRALLRQMKQTQN